MNKDNHDNSPIEEYLDGILVTSVGIGPRALRHLLAETEAHLRDIASEELRAGGTQVEAERAAIARFGSIEALVEGEAADGSSPWEPCFVRQSGLLCSLEVWLASPQALAA